MERISDCVCGDGENLSRKLGADAEWVHLLHATGRLAGFDFGAGVGRQVRLRGHREHRYGVFSFCKKPKVMRVRISSNAWMRSRLWIHIDVISWRVLECTPIYYLEISTTTAREPVDDVDDALSGSNLVDGVLVVNSHAAFLQWNLHNRDCRPSAHRAHFRAPLFRRGRMARRRKPRGRS